MTQWQFRFVLLAATFAAACNPSITGRWAAQETGELLEPPATRDDPRDGMVDRCRDAADATPEELAHLARPPYLQLVDTDSARLQWTSTSAAPLQVELTRPDGTALGTVDPTRQETTYLTTATQWVADLEGLEPSTVYCYRLRDVDGTGGPAQGFRTASEPGPDVQVAFVALGDFGSGKSDQHAIRDQMATVPWDLMLTTGDNAYPSGRLEDFEDKFFPVYDPLLRSLPVFPSAGNHDYGTDDAAPFREVFSLPTNGGDAGEERWYSFDWGNAHFVALDTERLGPEQTAWLEEDLAANELPRVIAYFHKPPFSSGSSHGSSQDSRDYLVPILERYGVDLVLTGHSHSYERTESINGVTYVVTGGGGEGVRPVGTSEWTAFSASVAHFMYVTVTAERIRVHAIDATGQEFDGVVIE